MTSQLDDRDRPSPDWELPPEPPIHRAARKGDLDELARLIEAGADINEKADLEFDCGPHVCGLTPLMAAARSINGATVATLRWLVEHGADLNARSEGTNSAAWYAAGHGGRLDFHKKAVTPDHVERLRYLLELGFDPTECNYAGRSLVTEAASAGDPARLRLLLNRGASPIPIQTPETDAQGPSRYFGGHCEPFSSYQIPIFEASTSGSAECVRLLVDAGADPNTRDHMGCTPLMQAGSAEVVAALLAAGADPAAPRGDDDVFDEVMQSSELTWPQMKEVAEALLAAGVRLEGSEPWDQSRLAKAAFNHHDEAVAFLLALGADPNTVGPTGTPLHSICSQGEYEDHDMNAACERIITLLVEAGADLEERAELGQRPLHKACGGDWGNQTAVRTLLRYGVEVDPMNEVGDTPLKLAADMGELECIRLLLEAGASAHHTNKSGETPIDAARAHVACWKEIVSEPPSRDTEFDEELRREMAEEGLDIDLPQESPEEEQADYVRKLQEAEDCLRLLRQRAPQ